MQQTTPISELKCPFQALNGGADADHVVTFDGGITYTCACGETFEWTSQLDYAKVPAP